MLKAPKSIISEIEKLTASPKIDVKNLSDLSIDYKYDPIQQFIKSLQIQTKPESAAHELFKSVIKDVLNYDTFHEVNIGTGFIDFAIRESNGNPILIELKPLFKLIKSKGMLKREELDFNEHKEQVLKYLRNNEYVILTNLNETFLFSRNAIIDFEPFKSIFFPELLLTVLEYQGNLWDTIRRIEDQNVKVDLDKTFFDDLKNWYNEFKGIEITQTDKFSKEELIVLLLNKIIFIRTLDDLGLIQFNHIVDEYINKKDKWEAKGSERILTTFFNELEEYFDYFYDTELFKQKFWDYVVKEKSNTDKFINIFETTLGLDAWNKAFGRGMLHYNYRWIDEDVFGKAYETFIAENKKDSGIFYTPREITTYMAKSTVDYLFEPLIEEIIEAIDKDNADYEKADELLGRLYQIKIIDTASGSGSFLIKVLKEIYRYYSEIDKALEWVVHISGNDLFDLPASYTDAKNFRNRHFFNSQIKLISKIILRHIFAADIDERALETAKTNIWKEAIKLRPAIYNYKKLNGESSHILPNLELNFVRGDSLADLTINKQVEIISAEFTDGIKRLHEIRNKYIDDPFHPEEIDEALQIKNKVFGRLKEELPQIEKPVFICLDFWFVYFDENGQPVSDDNKGFHGVIGNPPWEIIKPVEKEFSQKGKYELSKADFQKWFDNKIKEDKNFEEEWNNYKKFYSDYKFFINSRYSYQGGGDLNYYKCFFERDIELLRNKGYLSLLVPSGIQTDLGCFDLRHLLINKYQLRQMFSFENKGYKIESNGVEIRTKLFPDVHPQFKFTIINMEKSPSHPFNTFDGKFYMHDPLELVEREPINYNVKMINKFSPKNLSFMEFKTQKDYEICARILGDHELLEETGIRIRREFHMTDDGSKFEKNSSKSNAPVYEGKTIHQYNSNFSEINFFINTEQARIQLIKKEVSRIKKQFDIAFANSELSDSFLNKEYQIDSQTYRLVYRAIGSSTNERSIISTIIPPGKFTVNSLNYFVNCYYDVDKGDLVQNLLDTSKSIILMSLLNSLVLNYYIRNKISANLNIFYIYELPIPELTEEQEDFLVQSGAMLLYNKNDKRSYSSLMKELGIDTKKKVDEIKLRGDIEIFIAREVYKLSREDWEQITSTFVYGGDSTTKKELDQIIDYTLKNY